MGLDLSDRDVWLMLRRLNDCCTVKVESFIAAGGGLHWRMAIRSKDGGVPPIEVESADVVDAINRGLEEAERRGWITA